MLLTDVINEGSIIFEEVITRHHQLTYKSKAINIFLVHLENFLKAMIGNFLYISGNLSFPKMLKSNIQYTQYTYKNNLIIKIPSKVDNQLKTVISIVCD